MMKMAMSMIQNNPHFLGSFAGQGDLWAGMFITLTVLSLVLPVAVLMHEHCPVLFPSLSPLPLLSPLRLPLRL